LEGLFKEVVEAYFEVPFHLLPARMEEDNKNLDMAISLWDEN
jgi:hypothetical protein